MITIQVLGNQHVIMIVSASRGRGLAPSLLACDKQSQWGSHQEVASHNHATLYLTTMHDSLSNCNHNCQNYDYIYRYISVCPCDFSSYGHVAYRECCWSQLSSLTENYLQRNAFDDEEVTLVDQENLIWGTSHQWGFGAEKALCLYSYLLNFI